MRGLVLFATYLVAVLWLTWPLARFAAAYLPCTNLFCAVDVLYSTWVLAWQSHALSNAPAHLLDGNIYHPASGAVLYGPAGFGALPYFAPVFALTGNPALAMNATLLVCSALTATGMHLLVRRLTGNGRAGVLAASTYLGSGWVLFGFVAGAPHLAALQYFPFIMLLAILPLAGAWRILGLALLIVLQCLTDPVYVALAVLAPLSVLALIRLSRPRSRSEGRRLAAAIVAAVVVLLPVYLAYAGVRAANPQLAEQTAWQSREDPVSLSDLFSKTGSPIALSPGALGLIVVGACVALGRGAAGDRRGAASAWRHGLLWLAVGTALALPPSPASALAIPSPQTLVARWTSVYDVIRAPSRLGVAGLMGMCLLVGVAFAEIDRALAARPAGRRLRFAARAALTVTALAALFLLQPQRSAWLRTSYPLQSVPAVPAEFAGPLEASAAPLVHLPALLTGIGAPGVAWHARAMYQSLSHWRPLLNGYSSYWPKGFIDDMVLAERLPDQQALAELVERTGVGMVWVDVKSLPLAKRAQWTSPALASASPRLVLVARSGSSMLFAVTPSATGMSSPHDDR